MVSSVLAAILATVMSLGVWFMPAEAVVGPQMDAKLALVQQYGREGDWYYLHLRMPAQIQRIATALPDGSNVVLHCESYDVCAALLAVVEPVWFEGKIRWVGYDLEAWENSGADRADPVGSVRRVADLAHANGFKLLYIPCSVYIFRDHKAMIAQMAPLVDGWVVQGQSLVVSTRSYGYGYFPPASPTEAPPAAFKRLATSYVGLIRRAAPGIPIVLQLKLCTFKDGAWRSYMIPPQRSFYLLRDYWLPVRPLFNGGVILLDAFDPTNPFAAEQRPGAYQYFLTHAR